MLPTQEILDRSARTKTVLLMGLALLAGLLLLSEPELVTCERNSLFDLAEVARRTRDLHVALLWSCGAAALIVFGLLLYSIGSFRAPVDGPPAAFGRFPREIIWALIPVLIVVGMAMPAVNAVVAGESKPDTNPGFRCEINPRSPA